jgi:FixJ family two-component response regulator
MVNLNQIVAVVDDDESVCRAIKRLLRSVGIKAETFSSGEEFLDMLSSAASYRPACVILDFQMPGINGLELQRRLAPTGVPVIFITANDDPAVREKALASGATGYLRKPFNDAILVKAVEIALGATPIPEERFTP